MTPVAASRNLLFVGGVPLDSAEAVMRLCADVAGARALSLPDGELGDRSFWIGALGESVWSKHPALEPLPEDRDDPRDFGGTFRLKDRDRPLSLEGMLPYAPAAIEAYELLTRLREEGVVDVGTRLHVAFPTSHAAVFTYFRDAADWDVAFAAWAAGLRYDLATIVDAIPASELVVQLDYCTELTEIHGEHDVLGWVPHAPEQERFARYTSAEYIGAMVAGLPSDVLLGYHLCAGTYPTQPVSELADMRLPVRLANALHASTPHRVDYVQMPVMRDADTAYFAPLADLEIGDATVFLGVECDDGRAAMRRRIDAARVVLPRFGVSHHCGYRPDKAPRLRELFGDLVAGADLVR